jgi:hypothetical protein
VEHRASVRLITANLSKADQQHFGDSVLHESLARAIASRCLTGNILKTKKNLPIHELLQRRIELTRARYREMRTLLRDRNMTDECSRNTVSDGGGVVTGRIDVGHFLEERKNSMFELLMQIVRAIVIALTISIPFLL